MHDEREDALPTAETKEHWPVSRWRFERTYTAVAPTESGKPGVYVKLPILITATQIENPLSVAISNLRGEINGQIGDCLIAEPEGNQWVVAKEIFEKTYREML
ncbi:MULTISPECIES: PGDYG domain-containing protein [unclassified Undibacterium]|uniref:PGDYG domain-containing protein n=1 Tax=unclassified Undibacterium TaxID=2630295 RepID=UPI002AC8A020|nr:MULTISPECIES: PGDYG domain-containing protein [unclassified Undibacterium]MEB0138821.1 PGDYG domain-containing protein [Undibacterium sp. CCC2.1]MEB0170703.1 PGDYG domain-containing protein [Undibacterium sp. CCC1.1]MEB0177044.1 PGDYG domain-containing protein [Undibacterium sp. CCC3.4]MEB0216333.1 PGDYG domain-containing protein [Undibacterium sp. 5I2]WPX42517.1 PGDYG domain-containing protein [Undibacterium sp. CCC3.4]